MYQCAEEPDFSVRTTQDDIDFERSRSEAAASAATHATAFTDAYLETLAVYRKIAEVMPLRGVVLVHGSCVAVDGEAFLFCAPSGTGKSTHVRLWRELLGSRATMVNDDKPLVRVAATGAIAYGTPWDGKHRLSSNMAVPLRAVCLLSRADENHIERVMTADAYTLLLRHVYRPLDAEALVATLDLVDCLAASVELWRLRCNMEKEAAQLSYAAMSHTI
ncbi:MAG: hypothetical protein IKF14_17930 [Atopobiaceae bacterium]|nr:hypothetical protein [Atopobiaceae bacterium]